MTTGLILGFALIGAYYVGTCIGNLLHLIHNYEKEAVTVRRQTDQLNDTYRTTSRA